MYKLPIIFPDILIPDDSIPLEKWAVVACDQFTSNKGYWNELESRTKDCESSLHITFPEIYLSGDNASRIEKINSNMRSYIDKGIFKVYKNSAVLVDRSTPFNPHRRGVVLAVDLEAYSYVPTDKALIRATEGTILERIPPRVRIRENAGLELPHIMLLINDEKKSVIEPLFADNNEIIYDSVLNMNGGSIKGYKLKDNNKLAAALENLLKSSGDNILFAVGDGNHSLAAAKTCWNNIKANLSGQELLTHPARFALAEIVNIFDSGLKFEPIHRALFNVDADRFIAGFKKEAGLSGTAGIIRAGNRDYEVSLPDNAIAAVDTVQKFCEEWQKNNNNVVIDYIHGDDEISRIGGMANSLVIKLPKMEKSELFPYIINNGVLPRKTFSMGEGCEKRYYLEARKIKHN